MVRSPNAHDGAPPSRPLTNVLIVFTAILGASLFGILTRPVGFLAAFWPANVILLGLMVRNPRRSSVATWIAAFAGYVTADLITGGTVFKTIWLTSGNLGFAFTGYLLFQRLDDESKRLESPTSVLHVFVVCGIASLVAALIGCGAAPVFFNETVLRGFWFWFTTELVNAVVILPVMLAAPKPLFSVSKSLPPNPEGKEGRNPGPALFLLTSVVAACFIGGPGAIVFPVPALLWCALSYSIFSTAVITMVLCVGMMIVVSARILPLPLSDNFMFSMISVRLGIMMMALGPLTVVSINTLRNRLLDDERHNAEQLKKAKETAEEAERLKGDFLAIMTHEIRTPMSGIIGVTRLLAKTPLDAGQSELVNMSQHGTEKLLELIDDILDFSKIEAGKLEINPVPFKLDELIGDSLSLLTPLANHKGLKLESRLPDSPGILLLGDDTKIKRILSNLVGNAIKFTKQGSVTLSVTKTEEQADSVTLRFSVRDTGIGIPKELQPNLFKPFVQADRTISRQFGGTGLGLSICRQLVDSMGGSIGLESEEGSGSEFWFTLEITKDPAPEMMARCLSALEEPVGRPLHLLVVDDSPLNQVLLCKQLTFLGHQADAAGSGVEAVERLASSPYDVVIMDYHMPDLDGAETTEQIRSGGLPGIDRDVWIIGMTAAPSAEIVSRCLASGMNEIVSKGFDFETVQDALERSAPFREMQAV